jgi:hypothetical protein
MEYSSLEKTDKKPTTSTAVFRRFRRVSDVLDAFDYGLIVALKLRKPKPHR